MRRRSTACSIRCWARILTTTPRPTRSTARTASSICARRSWRRRTRWATRRRSRAGARPRRRSRPRSRRAMPTAPRQRTSCRSWRSSRMTGISAAATTGAIRSTRCSPRAAATGTRRGSASARCWSWTRTPMSAMPPASAPIRRARRRPPRRSRRRRRKRRRRRPRRPAPRRRTRARRSRSS